MSVGTVSPKAADAVIEVTRDLLATSPYEEDQMMMTLVISAFVIGLRKNGVSLVHEDD